MAVQSPELQAKIAMWKQKGAEGTIDIAEMREAIKWMRGDRLNAAETSKTRTTKSKGPARSADDLLTELGSL